MPPDAIAFNPLLFDVQQEPYSYYARLRDRAPVSYIASLDAWGVFRYDDVVYTLKHPELFSARDFIHNAFGEFDPVPEVPYELFENPAALAVVRDDPSRAADAVDGRDPTPSQSDTKIL